MKHSLLAVFLVLAGFALFAGLEDSAFADEDPPAVKPIAWKFTSGLYNLSGGGVPAGAALDLNLRATGNFGNVWGGYYRSPVQLIAQTRLGWDRTFDFGALRFQPTLEIASGGYLGAAGYVETGTTWFAGAGLSRTNLTDFVNLNFDPGDSYTLAGGYRWSETRSLTLELIRDNRTNPDQQNIHAIYRTPTVNGQRLTLDLLEKTGLVSGTRIQRFGAQAIYDWPRFFIRLAYDPLVNFTVQDMLRISVGTRF